MFGWDSRRAGEDDTYRDQGRDLKGATTPSHSMTLQVGVTGVVGGPYLTTPQCGVSHFKPTHPLSPDTDLGRGRIG